MNERRALIEAGIEERTLDWRTRAGFVAEASPTTSRAPGAERFQVCAPANKSQLAEGLTVAVVDDTAWRKFANGAKAAVVALDKQRHAVALEAAKRNASSPRF